MKKIYLLSSLIWATSLQGLTLQEAESRALMSSPLIQLSEYELQQNEARYSQAFLSWFPDLTFGSMVATLQKSQKISNFQKQKHLFSNQFTLYQPIFSSDLLTNLRLSRLAKENGSVEKEIATNEVLLQVRKTYLLFGVKQEEMTLEKVRLSFLQKVLQDEQVRFKAGTATSLQVAKAKAAISQEITRELSSQKDAMQARHELSLLLRFSPLEESELTFTGFPKLEDYPLLREKEKLVEQYLLNNTLNPSPSIISLFNEKEIQMWISRAKANRPEIRKSALYVEVAQTKTAQARTQYLPEISAFIDYGYYQPVNGQFFKQRNDWAGGIQLSWSLFDSFKREMKSKEITYLRKAAKTAFEYENDKLEMTIREDLHQIEEALFIYQTAQNGLFLAQQTLEETEVQYASGAIFDLQLLDAKRFLAESQFNQIEALAKVFQAYYQFLHDVGLSFIE